MRSAVQETMIDLAESDIKISIRKIWSQTVQVVKEHHPQYGLHALCGLLSYTRQAYYERLKYKQTRVLESDIILMPARAVRVDFPRRGG